MQEGGRILFEVGRSSVPIRDFSMEFPLHIWKGTPWQFQNTEIEKEDLISWLYALYSQTALRTQTTKYSTVHFVFGPLIQNEKASDMYLIALLSRLVLFILIFVFVSCFITNAKKRTRKNTVGQLANGHGLVQNVIFLSSVVL